MSDKLRPERWCWIEDDPEAAYPDPQEWVEDYGPFNCDPFVQKFDWGRSDGSSWLVVHDGEEERIVEEYSTAEDAEKRRSELAALAREQSK